MLNSVDAESTNPIPVIYQSGYLTIKGFDPVARLKSLFADTPYELIRGQGIWQ